MPNFRLEGTTAMLSIIGAGIPAEISTLEITCIEPGQTSEDVSVQYNDSHVQVSDSTQVALVYDPNMKPFKDKGMGLFRKIEANEVPDNLQNGVVQLAYNDGRLVLGIPGDVYAFNLLGTGFAFGNSRKPINPAFAFGNHVAPVHSAHELLMAMISYTQREGPGVQRVVATSHPDCELFASNEGVSHYEDLARKLNPDGSNFMGSEYQKQENHEKREGVFHLLGTLRGMGIRELIVRPTEYVQRKPAVVKALER